MGLERGHIKQDSRYGHPTVAIHDADVPTSRALSRVAPALIPAGTDETFHLPILDSRLLKLPRPGGQRKYVICNASLDHFRHIRRTRGRKRTIAAADWILDLDAALGHELANSVTDNA